MTPEEERILRFDATVVVEELREEVAFWKGECGRLQMVATEALEFANESWEHATPYLRSKRFVGPLGVLWEALDQHDRVIRNREDGPDPLGSTEYPSVAETCLSDRDLDPFWRSSDD